MQRQTLNARTIWTTILFGVLLATAPNWMTNNEKSTYDAPWIHPSQIEH